jgi:peptidyl-prolyl cis-trans isomerase SurA
MNLLKIIIIILITTLPEVTKAKIKNEIVVRVENKIITDYEIKNKILSSIIVANKEINQENINRIKSQSLETLIQLKLKKLEIDKFNLKKRETDKVNTYLNSISSNNIIGLQDKFKNNNLDFQLFVEEIETELMWQELIYKIYSKKIKIDEKNIDNELKKLIKNESDIVEFNISEIEIFLDDANSYEEKVLYIEDLIIKNGFDDVALKFSVSSSASNNGNLGWINSKSLSNEVYKIVINMEKKGISKPIKRQNSILFLKLNDIKKSKLENLNIPELKLKLINQKKNELFNLYSISHLSKLKNSSLIEYQ